jgi:hypothetical protein
MNIDILENKLQKINNPKIVAILELLIEATRDYPLYGLDDIFTYFKEVERVLDTEFISDIVLERYLNRKNYNNNETTIWVVSSLSLFYEAFELMKLYKVSFEEVKKHIRDLENN